jgi:hypothetical protein
VTVVDGCADKTDHRDGGEREGDGDVGAVRGAQFAHERAEAIEQRSGAGVHCRLALFWTRYELFPDLGRKRKV